MNAEKLAMPMGLLSPLNLPEMLQCDPVAEPWSSWRPLHNDNATGVRPLSNGNGKSMAPLDILSHAADLMRRIECLDNRGLTPHIDIGELDLDEAHSPMHSESDVDSDSDTLESSDSDMELDEESCVYDADSEEESEDSELPDEPPRYQVGF